MFIGGLATLIAGGELLVRGASGLALKFNISTLVIGLTVVAFSTSAPELLVCIQAALNNWNDIVMGNVMGSNMCNLGLVLGITAVIFPIKISKDSIRIDWPVMMVATIMLYFFVQNNYINTWEGGVFLACIIAFIVIMIFKTRTVDETETEHIPDEEEEAILQQKDKTLSVIFSLLLGGSLALTFGADWFVEGATKIAKDLGVTERMIGLTAVALGTSLPELVTSVVAATKKETDIAIGNIIGSNIFNIFLILGVTSLIREIRVSEAILSIDMLWVLGISAIMLPMMLTRRQIGRIEGAILLAIYFTYIYLLF
ncbi:MAG: calcium/sodium antiporter [Bacteroidia bacterium]|nr:calcium/sodium antiporter [Bacteroidia bacterium]